MYDVHEYVNIILGHVKLSYFHELYDDISVTLSLYF